MATENGNVEKVCEADKLEKVIHQLKPDSIDWKCVFISWGMVVILIAGLYMFKLKDCASHAEVDNCHLKCHTYIHNSDRRLSDKIVKLEDELKKLKEHCGCGRRIGSVGEAPH